MEKGGNEVGGRPTRECNFLEIRAGCSCGFATVQADQCRVLFPAADSPGRSFERDDNTNLRASHFTTRIYNGWTNNVCAGRGGGGGHCLTVSMILAFLVKWIET